MPQSTREIRKRIRSINNTKKITKAMELVAASKMRKTVELAQATRAYSHAAWQMIQDLSKRTNPKLHPLLQKRPLQKRLTVVMSSNRGLCGGFNNFILQKVIWTLKKDNVPTEFITYGGKVRNRLLQQRHKVIADFNKEDVLLSIEPLFPLVRLIRDEFTRKRYDEVLLVFTDYKSALRQEVAVKRLLPLVLLEGEPRIVEENNDWRREPGFAKDFEYIYEPNTEDVMKAILPKLLEVQIFQAALENNASEQASRMLAMRNASDAAADMISELTLAFNRARQAGITSEIAEISAGTAAIIK